MTFSRKYKKVYQKYVHKSVTTWPNIIRFVRYIGHMKIEYQGFMKLKGAVIGK